MNKADLVELLTSSGAGGREARIVALKTLWTRQTCREQQGNKTVEKNGKGFSRWDVAILSDFIRQVKAGRILSDRQDRELRIRLPKYWKQLLNES